MNILILFSLFTLILSAPANVLVVTKTRVQTVVVGNNGPETHLIVPTSATSSTLEPLTTTITKTLTRTHTQDGETKVDEAEVKQTLTQTSSTLETAVTTNPDVLEKIVSFQPATSESPETSATITSTTSTTPIKSSATSTTPTSSPTSTTSSDSSETGSSGEQKGEGTYYSTGLGACGVTNQDTDYIVAISHELFDETNTGNPNNNPVCGKKIKANYQGKSVEVKVTDRCEGCAYGDLDFSPSAFTQLADKSLGRIDITWDWM